MLAALAQDADSAVQQLPAVLFSEFWRRRQAGHITRRMLHVQPRQNSSCSNLENTQSSCFEAGHSACCLVCYVLQDKLYSPDQLNELMSVCDYIVMATPYTPSTHQLINAAAIAAMKPNGVLVNVGRGKCINEAALIEGKYKPYVSCSITRGLFKLG